MNGTSKKDFYTLLVAVAGVLGPLVTAYTANGLDPVVAVATLTGVALVAIAAIIGLSGATWLEIARGLRIAADVVEDLADGRLDQQPKTAYLSGKVPPYPQPPIPPDQKRPPDQPQPPAQPPT